MVKTLQVSDETYARLALVKRATKVTMDTLVRYSLESLVPGVLDPGFLKVARKEQTATIVQDFAEFLAAHVEVSGEWDGWTEKKVP